MPKFNITIKDTITIARKCQIEVECADEDTANEIADRMTATCVCPAEVTSYGEPGKPLEFDEDQIDNEPWETEVEEVFPHSKLMCPSKHWNRGDDICADCGELLG